MTSPTLGKSIFQIAIQIALLTFLTVADDPSTLLFAFILGVQLITFPFFRAFLMTAIDPLGLCRFRRFLVSNR